MSSIHRTVRFVIAAGAALSLGMATTALAADGTITFSGAVTNTTCTIGGSDSGNQTVLLPTVSTTSLQSAGQTAGTTAFQITLSNCSAGSDGGGATPEVTTYFESGPTVDPDTGTLRNAADGGAGQVNVQILGSNSNPIVVGSQVSAAGNQQNSQRVTLNGDPSAGTGSATLNYAARYYATGQATAGQVNTTVQYTLAYP